jgi:hypothetical protein
MSGIIPFEHCNDKVPETGNKIASLEHCEAEVLADNESTTAWLWDHLLYSFW